jgi:hypothetical protein
MTGHRQMARTQRRQNTYIERMSISLHRLGPENRLCCFAQIGHTTHYRNRCVLRNALGRQHGGDSCGRRRSSMASGAGGACEGA